MSGDPLASIRNEAERLVCAYLLHCGYTDIQHEPAGMNLPPDFLINKRIAIEVRRLDQNHDDGNRTRSLEDISIPLWRAVRKLLTSLGPPTLGQSWFVSYRFSRPIHNWKVLPRKLRGILRAFMVETDPQPFDCDFGNSFVIQVSRAETAYSTFFVLLGDDDEQSGGWLLGEMEKNLNLCIAEKTRKIAKMRHKYGEWWLVMVDLIGYGLDHFDQGLLRDQISLASHSFDKIILVAPNDHTRAFEV